ncbi:hypothetical protein PA7_31760 [Pseudonocardia asaccharolytica DSM 44247 = NBRC 16224]|uniref:Uncharacterized protein n=1 Tax=Pseudonocardia asaccharolytica DSM 44247 = NBRC 16224 TaxID=1123024 RepID=A0A511D3H6_9PSEU|nr:hypothetical protein PA7_31760 [Pseudonocardia asaccharolytica DSM 44247 = NBRC 16224]
MVKHGTPAAYNRCYKRPEGSCEACRAAKRAYIRQWKDRKDPGRTRRRPIDPTPLPGGGYAERVWKGLSEPQRVALEDLARGRTPRGTNYIATIRALCSKELVLSVSFEHQLSARGNALLVWAEKRGQR